MSDEAELLYRRYINSKEPDLLFTDTNKKSNNHTQIEQMPIPRYDPCLIRVVEELGEKANVGHSCLTIVKIDDDIEWIIEEYDGYEWISQNHKILSYYPLYIYGLIRGKGMESQELYNPNKKNIERHMKINPSDQSTHGI